MTLSDKNIFLNEIIECNSVAIYGAGVMGQALFKCLSDDPYRTKVGAFIVRNMDGNPSEINGIPDRMSVV